jgi:hypothetical protein
MAEQTADECSRQAFCSTTSLSTRRACCRTSSPRRLAARVEPNEPSSTGLGRRVFQASLLRHNKRVDDKRVDERSARACCCASSLGRSAARVERMIHQAQLARSQSTKTGRQSRAPAPPRGESLLLLQGPRAGGRARAGKAASPSPGLASGAPLPGRAIRRAARVSYELSVEPAPRCGCACCRASCCCASSCCGGGESGSLCIRPLCRIRLDSAASVCGLSRGLGGEEA